MEHQSERLLSPDSLKRIGLLSALSNEELSEVATHMAVKRFAKGDTVVSKGSHSDALMFLVVGRLQAVDYTEDGREVGLNLFAPGAFFGELALIDGQPRSASIIALESATVLFLAKDSALRLIYGKPAVAEKMLKHFAGSIRNLTSYRALLAIPNTHQRLYALLSQMKRQINADEAVIENLPSQRQLAIMINTSRETVSRALTELEQKGVLRKISRSQLSIRVEELARLAHGETDPRD